MAAALAVLVAAGSPGAAWGALELTVTPPPVPVVTGDSPTVTATVKNTGAVTEEEVSILFQGQDSDEETVKPSATSSCIPFVLLACQVGNLAPGQSASVTVTYGPLKSGSASMNVNANAGGFPTFTWETPVSPPARLTLDLAAQPASLTAGNATAVAATVRNSGAGPAFGATLRIGLPFGMSPAALPDGCSAAGLSITCALGDIPSLGNAERTIPIRPPEVGSYTVLATATWARPPTVPGDVTIGVLPPAEPDVGGGGLGDLGVPATPAVARTVTLESVSRGLPGRNRCVRGRVLDVLLRSPGGVDPQSAVVRIGKKVVKRLSGVRARRPFTLRVPRSRKFVLRLSVTLKDGRRFNASRTYRVCPRRSR